MKTNACTEGGGGWTPVTPRLVQKVDEGWITCDMSWKVAMPTKRSYAEAMILRLADAVSEQALKKLHPRLLSLGTD